MKNDELTNILFQKSNKKGLFFITGPCVVESRDICFKVAEKIAQLNEKYKDNTFVFKASYDKANRTSVKSFRGVGPTEGLKILGDVKSTFGLPILTDIHHPEEATEAAEIADILQIPAFLCRQTDLLVAAGKSGAIVNIKKGQFSAPADMKHAIGKTGSDTVIVTERGTFFGYNRLVVDFAGLHALKENNVPVVFDATHSVQNPGGGDGCSSGNRDLAVPLARAALCQNIDGLFFEIHPNPNEALCDGPNSLFLDDFIKQAPKLIELHRTIKEW